MATTTTDLLPALHAVLRETTAMATATYGPSATIRLYPYDGVEPEREGWWSADVQYIDAQRHADWSDEVGCARWAGDARVRLDYDGDVWTARAHAPNGAGDSGTVCVERTPSAALAAFAARLA